MAKKPVEATQEVEDKQTEDAQTEPQIQFEHISAVAEIIDLCSARGAFRGPELEAVGKVRNAFAAFIEFHTPKEDDKTPAAPVAEAPVDPAE